MQFPPRECRLEQYQASGHIVAETARGIGLPIDTPLEDRWAETVGLLALADDVSEVDPCQLTAESLLGMLRLEPSAELELSAQLLLEANIRSRTATSIDAHFEARTEEAHHSFGLLHHQAGELATRHVSEWSQLYTLARLSLHLDSMVDAYYDADELNFTPFQLIAGAVKFGAREAYQLDRQTWRAVFEVSHRYGFDWYVLGKPKRAWRRHLAMKQSSQVI